MFEPSSGQGAVGGFCGGEFPNGFRLRTGMGEHVDEIQHYDIERVTVEVVEVLYQFFPVRGFIDFVIGKVIFFPVSVELGSDERCLVEVFPLLFIFVDP